MKTGNLMGVMLLLFGSCAGLTAKAAENPSPLPPSRLDIQIQPSPYTAVPPDITRRFPMVIAEVDPSQFPMPVTQGRVGNYPIHVIPPADLHYTPLTSELPSTLRLTPSRTLPARPKR